MGQKIAEGRPDDVRATPQVIKAYLGEARSMAPSGAAPERPHAPDTVPARADRASR
jgi:branched-subunit amino acid ATP-binding cassette transporter